MMSVPCLTTGIHTPLGVRTELSIITVYYAACRPRHQLSLPSPLCCPTSHRSPAPPPPTSSSHNSSVPHPLPAIPFWVQIQGMSHTQQRQQNQGPSQDRCCRTAALSAVRQHLPCCLSCVRTWMWPELKGHGSRIFIAGCPAAQNLLCERWVQSLA